MVGGYNSDFLSRDLASELLTFSKGLQTVPLVCVRVCKDLVVIAHIKRQVVDESLFCFRGAPGPSHETVQVRSKHGAGVVEREEWIEKKFLEFPLSCDTSPPAWCSEMKRLRMVSF